MKAEKLELAKKCTDWAVDVLYKPFGVVEDYIIPMTVKHTTICAKEAQKIAEAHFHNQLLHIVQEFQRAVERKKTDGDNDYGDRDQRSQNRAIEIMKAARKNKLPKSNIMKRVKQVAIQTSIEWTTPWFICTGEQL